MATTVQVLDVSGTTVQIVDDQTSIQVTSPGPQGPRGPGGIVVLDCGAPTTDFTAAFSLDCGEVT